MGDLLLSRLLERLTVDEQGWGELRCEREIGGDGEAKKEYDLDLLLRFVLEPPLWLVPAPDLEPEASVEEHVPLAEETGEEHLLRDPLLL